MMKEQMERREREGRNDRNAGVKGREGREGRNDGGSDVSVVGVGMRDGLRRVGQTGNTHNTPPTCQSALIGHPLGNSFHHVSLGPIRRGTISD